MRKTISKAGCPLFIPSMEELEGAMECDGGFCLGCGSEAYNVEPDAQKYTCESCGAHRVYGAEELVLMGLVDGVR